MTKSIAASPFVAIALLAACSPGADRTSVPADRTPLVNTEAAIATVPPTATARSTANDGIAVTLSPLTQQEIEAADLPPELGCSFSDASGPLLVGKGIIGAAEPARAVVKIGGRTVALTARGAGYAAMETDGRFTGNGLEFDIEPRGAPTPNFESRTVPAQLTILRDGEVELLVDGNWICGP